jgi:hypothetical protein
LGTGNSYVICFQQREELVWQEPDSGVLVAVGSSALLQPANNAIATKPVAIIVLFFIAVPYYLFWVYLPGIISKEIHANTRND